MLLYQRTHSLGKGSLTDIQTYMDSSPNFRQGHEHKKRDKPNLRLNNRVNTCCKWLHNIYHNLNSLYRTRSLSTSRSWNHTLRILANNQENTDNYAYNQQGWSHTRTDKSYCQSIVQRSLVESSNNNRCIDKRLGSLYRNIYQFILLKLYLEYSIFSNFFLARSNFSYMISWSLIFLG